MSLHSLNRFGGLLSLEQEKQHSGDFGSEIKYNPQNNVNNSDKSVPIVYLKDLGILVGVIFRHSF